MSAQKLILFHYLFPVLGLFIFLTGISFNDISVNANSSAIWAFIGFSGSLLSVTFIIIRLINGLFLQNEMFVTLISLSISFLLISKIFKVMHWPFGSVLLTTGLILLAISGIIYSISIFKK